MGLVSQAISRLYDFQPGKKAYSSQVDDELNQIIDAVNSVVTDVNAIDTYKATVDMLNNIAGVGRTTETVRQNAVNMTNHKASGDHDSRYYTETEIDTKISTINTNVANNQNNILNHKSSADHDGRYYTKTELQAYLRGGDTNIKEEVFTIINSNNGDGTFTYSNKGQTIIGQLTAEGYQVFDLTKGYYDIGTSRIEVIVNDTLRRSVESGGIIETSSTSFALTATEGSGAEITVKYYERLGMAAEYNIKMGTEKPPKNDGKTMWFKIIG